MTLKDSKFENLNSTKGGAVYIEQIDAIKTGDTFYVIDNCEFLNNYAFYGGALLLENPENVFMESNLFKLNRAVNNSNRDGNGGGMYYSCNS